MFTRYLRALLPGLALAVLLIGLSGCGSQAAAPDRVQIASHLVDPQVTKPTVILTDASLVQQLYTTVVALPQLPQNTPCTDEFGPSYTLTFLLKGKTLTTVAAQRFGCGLVSLPGETQSRKATPTFWTQLDQAIGKARPVAGS